MSFLSSATRFSMAEVPADSNRSQPKASTVKLAVGTIENRFLDGGKVGAVTRSKSPISAPAKESPAPVGITQFSDRVGWQGKEPSS